MHARTEVVVVQGGGSATFQHVWLSLRVGRCEWVSVESDCVRECERDRKQARNDQGWEVERGHPKIHAVI